MDGYAALQGYIGHADSNDMCRLEGNGPTVSEDTGAEAQSSRALNEQHEMYFGEVAERSIAAGCKPAAFGLRRFEPSPPHQLSLARRVKVGAGQRKLMALFVWAASGASRRAAVSGNCYERPVGSGVG